MSNSKNTKQTSKKVASKAAKILKDPKQDAASQSVAGSALVQAPQKAKKAAPKKKK